MSVRSLLNSLFKYLRLSFQLDTPWRTAYGGKYTVTLIHGDGVGPELMEHVKAAIRFIKKSPFKVFI